MDIYEPPKDNPPLDVFCPGCQRSLQITFNEEVWEEISNLTWRCDRCKEMMKAKPH